MFGGFGIFEKLQMIFFFSKEVIDREREREKEWQEKRIAWNAVYAIETARKM